MILGDASGGSFGAMNIALLSGMDGLGVQGQSFLTTGVARAQVAPMYTAQGKRYAPRGGGSGARLGTELGPYDVKTLPPGAMPKAPASSGLGAALPILAVLGLVIFVVTR